MTIAAGDRLPDATLLMMGTDGPTSVALHDKLKGRRVVIFAVPGAFTPTCSQAHRPSFIGTADAFRDKGIDEIICITVGDVFVVSEWGKVTGADEAGITLMADADSSYSRSIGLVFDAPPVGLYARPTRHAMIVKDGAVEVLQIEDSPGTCDMTGGETLLEMV